jgi:hypothetical protein
VADAIQEVGLVVVSMGRTMTAPPPAATCRQTLHERATSMASDSLPDQSGKVNQLAYLLRAYYSHAVERAGWTPNWRYDAERILEVLASDEEEAR